MTKKKTKLGKFWLFLNVRYDAPTGMDGYSGAFDSFDEAVRFSFESGNTHFHEAQIVEVIHNIPGRQWRRDSDDSEFEVWDEDISSD